MSPTETIAERIGDHEAAACIALLKEAGWIIVRHDAIKLAQAHAANDNWPERQAMQTGGRV